MNVTADTITNDQIRDLECDALYRLRSPQKRWAAVDLATQALDAADPTTGARTPQAVAARARCAAIWNTRQDSAK